MHSFYEVLAFAGTVFAIIVVSAATTVFIFGFSEGYSTVIHSSVKKLLSGWWIYMVVFGSVVVSYGMHYITR